jgi:hypothetical protein
MSVGSQTVLEIKAEGKNVQERYKGEEAMRNIKDKAPR